MVETQASAIWLQELRTELTAPPSRLRAYVDLHLHLPIHWSLFKASPYLRVRPPNILALLRLRTQSCVDWIPTHMHFNRSGCQPDYPDHFCPLCPSCLLGDELHMIAHCPDLHAVGHTHSVAQPGTTTRTSCLSFVFATSPPSHISTPRTEFELCWATPCRPPEKEPPSMVGIRPPPLR